MLVRSLRRFLVLGVCLLPLKGMADTPVVLAELDGIAVTNLDVERYLAFQRPDAEIRELLGRPNAVMQYVQNILIVRSMAKQAQQNGLGIDQDQLAWQTEYQRASWDAARLQANVVSQARDNVDWEALAKEKYLAEPERFARSPRVNASHILISTDEKSDEQALREIEAIHQRALAGEDFAELAKELSDDKGSGAAGGELGFFKANKMVKPFSEAAFALENEGDISAPVKTRYGYHIIKLNRKDTLKKDPFIAVKGKLIEELRRQMASEASEQLVTEIRTSTLEADIDHEAVAALEAKYGAETKNSAPATENVK
ncbi:peptidylprolyl isomerase [Gilvimarinus sp. SDUM040013]|uniref:peptidylprolyl isomerase n=1 Tax=Gilvimarinus gilvus TaxID=3058038 RepID=A0ABU4S064_9GAMM|nr:peptidylprolyl isomerase [Gilvimarinus sp. SDUM040013]MDO3385250.1 peptidylprolyl isomerase [Gilvimarinus sp. SDUM040013]MDX6849233.1 peptidylprolyl isomerase [Gilvimarinus sp. SDUM040013]